MLPPPVPSPAGVAVPLAVNSARGPYSMSLGAEYERFLESLGSLLILSLGIGSVPLWPGTADRVQVG